MKQFLTGLGGVLRRTFFDTFLTFMFWLSLALALLLDTPYAGIAMLYTFIFFLATIIEEVVTKAKKEIIEAINKGQ
jgi:hypothetical protein